MNILFITYQGDMAGSTNSISYLAKGLTLKGHNIYVGCRKESLLYELLKGSLVITIPMTFTGRFDLNNMRQIRDAVKQFDIQIINAQSSWDRYSTIFAKWIYRLNVKIIHTRRQTPESIGGWLQNTFYTKGTDKIVAVSDQLKKTFVEKGMPEHHIHVIYNGIPSERYSLVNDDEAENLRKRFDIQDSDIVIGCVSRRKKQEQLIEALQFLDANIKVVFVGIAPGSLDNYIEKFKVKQRIIYAGIVNSEEVLNYYKLFTVKVLPSTMDGFGLVLVEAMALGKPVVATRAEGIIDVLEDGKSGLMFKDGDIMDLAEKIKTVLYNESIRNQIIERGKARALNVYSMDNTIENYEKLFGRLTKN